MSVSPKFMLYSKYLNLELKFQFQNYVSNLQSKISDYQSLVSKYKLRVLEINSFNHYLNFCFDKLKSKIEKLKKKSDN